MNDESRQIRKWGERIRLLPTAMSYAFSANLRFAAVEAGHRMFLQAEGAAQDGDGLATFHVLGNQTITTALGAHEEVPACRLVQGFAEIVADRGADSASITGKLTFTNEHNECWRTEVRGVVSPRGGVSRLRGAGGGTATGTVFWSSRQECTHPRTRWLARHQLFWVGRFEQTNNVGSNPGALEVTFDVHTAA